MKPKNKMEIPNVLLVENPYNGKHVNILPLMELMNENWEVRDDGPRDVAVRLQMSLDYFAIFAKPETDLDVFQESLFNITKIRKAFDAMKEIRV
jgi:hypothetical protein